MPSIAKQVVYSELYIELPPGIYIYKLFTVHWMQTIKQMDILELNVWWMFFTIQYNWMSNKTLSSIS